MDYYSKCMSLIHSNNATISECEPDNTSITSTTEIVPCHSTAPAILSQKATIRDDFYVYYISDLHLDNHVVRHFPTGVDDSQVKQYIHGIVQLLFEGSFRDDLVAFRSPTILFGGDIASSFDITEFFYRDFLSSWQCIQDEQYQRLKELFAPLTEKMAEASNQISEWESQHPWIKNATKPLSEYSDQRVPKRIKQLIEQREQLNAEYRALRERNGISYGWEREYETSRKHRYIYAVLGNHELWDYTSYELCKDAYSHLFEELGINFLNGGLFWLGPHRVPIHRVSDASTGLDTMKALKREDDPLEYDRQLFWLDNILITGGLGFAGLNDSFNADQQIYGIAVSRDEEISRCSRWRDSFRRYLEDAKENHCTLVSLTHMPASDWLDTFEGVDNCVFFSGHNHRNTAYGGDNNVFFFADNQVGYTGNGFHFKRTNVYKPRNPFASDSDGYREITCDEYREFYRYINEAIPGTGVIDRQIKQYGGNLWVIKKEGYYGFFLVTPKGTYICNGGQIRKTDHYENLDFQYICFSAMVKAYLQALSPLRKMQEKISAYVKGLGGSGTIHGTIVDIDFENHVMININDGSVTFYNSPVFGMVKTYPSIELLLHEHCPELESHLHKAENALVVKSQSSTSESLEAPFEAVDIKNSPYKYSRRINALQRLFDRNVMRDWNSELLFKYLSSAIEEKSHNRGEGDQHE